MNKKTAKALEEVMKNIVFCTKCDFRKELESRGLYYKPDAPLWQIYKKPKDPSIVKYEELEFTDNEYKVLSIGINPGWDNHIETEWQEAYKQTDYPRYVEKYFQTLDKLKSDNEARYFVNLARLFGRINDELNIYDTKEFTAKNIFKYIMWLNLAFCNSKTPHEVILSTCKDEKILRRVYSEEIPNCLDNCFLKQIITLLNPELILFLTVEALSYIYYKRLLSKLLDIKYDDIESPEMKEVPAYVRNGKEVKVTFFPCRIKNSNTKIIFMPHPNFRFEATRQEKAIKEVCSWLKQ